MCLRNYKDSSPMADDAGPIPFDVKRTATLPSLTHIDISSSPRGCAVALAHLDLPALTCLNVKVDTFRRDGNDVLDVFPYIGKHAHGSQDTRPLQSMLIWGTKTQADFLAWPVPNIDVELQGSTFLAATALARVALSFWCGHRDDFDTHNEVHSMAMRAIPLDGLVTLIAHDFLSPFEQFLFPSLPRLPLLQHVRVASYMATRFIDWLQADNEGRKDPLLSSLKELVVVNAHLDEHWTLRLCETLMKRVEQGVPLKMLDLRTCRPDPSYPVAVRSLSEIVVDVLAPEETPEARAQIISMWDQSALDSLVEHGF